MQCKIGSIHWNQSWNLVELHVYKEGKWMHMYVQDKIQVQWYYL
jgi:hypothetical protein